LSQTPNCVPKGLARGSAEVTPEDFDAVAQTTKTTASLTSDGEQPRTVLIDGAPVLFKAFYGLPMLNLNKSAESLATSAAFGYTRMILKYLGEFKSQYIAVAFDGGANFRKKIQTDYKANRQPTPDVRNI